VWLDSTKTKFSVSDHDVATAGTTSLLDSMVDDVVVTQQVSESQSKSRAWFLSTPRTRKEKLILPQE